MRGNIMRMHAYKVNHQEQLISNDGANFKL